MFLVDWIKTSFNDLMSFLGLLPEEANIVFLGLDNAGKTTLLRMMKDDRMTTNQPTLHPHAEELKIGSRLFRTWDVGGHESARRIWKDYYTGVDAVFFLVDAADRTRLEEARIELKYLLENPALHHVPFAILGNKIDVPTACGEDELRQKLDLPTSYNYNHKSGGPQQYTYRANGGGPIEVFMVSLKTKMGYSAAFRYVSEVLKNNPKKGVKR